MAENWKGDDNQNGAVGPHFLVHYQGWKKTYVPPPLIQMGRVGARVAFVEI